MTFPRCTKLPIQSFESLSGTKLPCLYNAARDIQKEKLCAEHNLFGVCPPVSLLKFHHQKIQKGELANPWMRVADHSKLTNEENPNPRQSDVNPAYLVLSAELMDLLIASLDNFFLCTDVSAVAQVLSPHAWVQSTCRAAKIFFGHGTTFFNHLTKGHDDGRTDGSSFTSTRLYTAGLIQLILSQAVWKNTGTWHSEWSWPTSGIQPRKWTSALRWWAQLQKWIQWLKEPQHKSVRLQTQCVMNSSLFKLWIFRATPSPHKSGQAKCMLQVTAPDKTHTPTGISRNVNAILLRTRTRTVQHTELHWQLESFPGRSVFSGCRPVMEFFPQWMCPWIHSTFWPSLRGNEETGNTCSVVFDQIKRSCTWLDLPVHINNCLVFPIFFSEVSHLSFYPFSISAVFPFAYICNCFILPDDFFHTSLTCSVSFLLRAFSETEQTSRMIDRKRKRGNCSRVKRAALYLSRKQGRHWGQQNKTIIIFLFFWSFPRQKSPFIISMCPHT